MRSPRVETALGDVLLVGTALVALAVASCGRDRGRVEGGVPIALQEEVRGVDVPADTGSAQPFLFRDGEGGVGLTWLARTAEGERALFFARTRGASFGEPSVVVRGDSLFANWADTPGAVAFGDGNVLAWWLVRTGEGYAYHVRASISSDGGSTWGAPLRVHDDVSLTEHGFVSAVPDGDGVRLIWLDGHKYEGAEHGHEGTSPAAEMELHSVRFDASGGRSAEEVVDTRVCDCCQTAATAVPGGTLVAYRDRSDGELRDITLAMHEGSAWTERPAVRADGWKIEACPVNGPVLDRRRDAVGLAWFTGAGDTARVFAALSADGGRSFGAPVRVDEGNPAGRTGVAVLEDGSALVSWIESEVDTGHVLVRRVTARGASISRPIAKISTSRRSGVPRILVSDQDVWVVWTETGPPSRVRLARTRLERGDLDGTRVAAGPRRASGG